MKKILFLLLPLLYNLSQAQELTPFSLPDSIYSGEQGKFHVQGAAIDHQNGHVYFSFTNKLVKTDLSGKVIGSVTGFIGHLGDLDFDPASGKIYASLEFKNDAIGKGISNTLGIQNQGNIGFYIAMFDGSKIVRPDMHAEKEDLLRTVYVREAVEDYQAVVKMNNKEVQHRFACSGIDGITLAPTIGQKNSNKKYLYVAYGVYGDTSRSDNDNQVILQYDISDFDSLGKKLSQDDLHQSGPKKPLEKYFVKTGNTTYGIQNLAYDEYSGNFYAAVYQGKKSEFPNYTLFVIDGKKEPFKDTIISNGNKMKVKQLSLVEAGPKDKKTGIRGWHFKWGATGLRPLGNGFFYISHNRKHDDGQQSTTLYKYKWIGSSEKAFVMMD